ncbi:hypothetical protein [Xenorhabdus cabanillasii]|nr:hypothetical protein [Xenorhabdus cabanillasii]
MPPPVPAAYPTHTGWWHFYFQQVTRITGIQENRTWHSVQA